MKFISHTRKDSYEQMDSMGSNIVQVWYGNGLLGAGQAILLQEIGDGPLALGWGRRWWQWRAARSQMALLLAAAAPVAAREGRVKGETRVPVAPSRQHRHQHNDKDMQ